MDFSEIVFWHWWVIALVFLVLEMLVTAYFFLWLAASAVVVGAITFFMPDMDWHLQGGIWAVLAIVTLVSWKFYRRANPVVEENPEPGLNQRGLQYVGRTFTLDKPVVNGKGKIEVDDSIWKVECSDDLEVGVKVKVTGTEGTVLKVEKV